MELQIVATIEVKEPYKNELLTVFKNVVDESRKEIGNISYDLFQDVKNPLKFVIMEVWKSQDAIDEHNASIHFNDFVKKIDGKVNSLIVDVVKKVY
ncbi:MAG: putative quinol monooxygenase [Dysgonomonas sp.]